MGSAENIFSYCIGALALITSISSVLFYCRLYLPATQLRLLDELLVETRGIYHKVKGDGLLRPEPSKYAEARLRRYEDESDVLREVTYRARSCIDILRTLLQGHTIQIMGLADKVGILRSFLITTSQKEKACKAQILRHNRTAPPELHGEDNTVNLTTCVNDFHIESGYQPPPEDLSSLPTSLDQSTDLASAHSLPADKDRRTPTCVLCSFLRWAQKWSRTDPGLPSFVVMEEDQCSTSVDNGTLRASTLPPAHKYTWHPRYSISPRIPICDWVFLSRRADPAQKSGLDRPGEDPSLGSAATPSV